MKQAVQIQTQVDQALVDAIPGFKPLLGHRARIIALDLEPSGERTASGLIAPPREEAGTDQPEGKITFEEFLATRPAWPKDRPPVTLEAMQRAIIQGAIDSASLRYQRTRAPGAFPTFGSETKRGNRA